MLGLIVYIWGNETKLQQQLLLMTNSILSSGDLKNVKNFGRLSNRNMKITSVLLTRQNMACSSSAKLLGTRKDESEVSKEDKTASWWNSLRAGKKKWRATTDTSAVPPQLKLTLPWWGGFPPRSFYPSASTRRAKLSVAAKVVRPTDLFNNVKYLVNTD